MPVGHERLNNPNADPNPDITFIRALADQKDSDKALLILQALAAQFRPITKSRGYGINSLVEHEWNTMFSGRNWNGGEIIEIVLRRKDGTFAPYKYLLYVLCHELAHISEMNHSHSFQKINKEIRSELSLLRSKKYFGDGFWSKGRSLTAGNNNNGAENEFKAEDQPVYVCGGANKRRSAAANRTLNRNAASPQPKLNKDGKPKKSRAASAKTNGQSGRQTSIGRVAGSRVKSTTAFSGGGQVLGEGGSTFRKQANSLGAIEARAKAAEARMKAEKKIKREEERKLAKMNSSINSKNKIKKEIQTINLCDSSNSDQDEEEDQLDDDDDDDDDDDVGSENEEEKREEIIESFLEEDEKKFNLSDLDLDDEWNDDWEDDIIIVENGQAIASGSGSNNKGKEKEKPKVIIKPISSKSNGKKRSNYSDDSEMEGISAPRTKRSQPKKLKSTTTSTTNSKGKGRKVMSESELDSDSDVPTPGKKKLLATTTTSKNSAQGGSSTTSTRKWRADDDERMEPDLSSSKPKKRKEMIFFKEKPKLQRELKEINKKKSSSSRHRRQSNSASSSHSIEPSDDEDEEVNSDDDKKKKKVRKVKEVLIISSSEDEE